MGRVGVALGYDSVHMCDQKFFKHSLGLKFLAIFKIVPETNFAHAFSEEKDKRKKNKNKNKKQTNKQTNTKQTKQTNKQTKTKQTNKPT